MDFTYLHTFCEVARSGNFTRAAEALGYAQSSVTTQIQRLEERYGAVLFERYGRRMQLTQAGEVLLMYARKILALQTEAIVHLSEQSTGTLTIGTIETLAAFYLPPILQRFRQKYPQITLAIHSGNEASIVQAVKDGDCDLGFILDRPVVDPDVVGMLLRQEEFAIIARPDSLYAQASELGLHDLANARLILTEEGCSYRTVLLQALRAAGTPHAIACEFGSLEAIKQCVMCGLGIGFLPRLTVQEEVAEGKLQAMALTPTSLLHSLHTQAIYLERRWRSHAFQYLLDLLGQAASPEG